MISLAIALLAAVSPSVSVTLSVPEYRTERQESRLPLLGMSSQNCFVVIRNESRSTIQVLAQGSSWGDEAVSYKAVTPDGKRVTVSGSAGAYSKNFPSSVRLAPGQVYVRRFWLRPDQMQRLTSLGSRVSIRAIFTETAADRRVLHSPEVWIGQTASAPVSVQLGS